MLDPRNRLRPLLHSGVPYKVAGVVDELLDLDDDALYDWVLDAAWATDAAISAHWQWKYDFTREVRHPSLTAEPLLSLLARARTPRALALRGELTHLCIELGSERSGEPALDVSMLGGLTDVTKLRLLPVDPPSLYAWRRDLMGKAKPLRGLASIRGMTALEHLTIVAGAGVDLGLFTELPALRHLELIACDVDRPELIAQLAVAELVLDHCRGVRAMEGLADTVKHARFVGLPDLERVGRLGGGSLERVELIGNPNLAEAPAVGDGVALEFAVEAPIPTSF